MLDLHTYFASEPCHDVTIARVVPFAANDTHRLGFGPTIQKRAKRRSSRPFHQIESRNMVLLDYQPIKLSTLGGGK